MCVAAAWCVTMRWLLFQIGRQMNIQYAAPWQPLVYYCNPQKSIILDIKCSTDNCLPSMGTVQIHVSNTFRQRVHNLSTYQVSQIRFPSFLITSFRERNRQQSCTNSTSLSHTQTFQCCCPSGVFTVLQQRLVKTSNMIVVCQK